MARARDIDTRPASVEKTFFDLSKGLVTEISPLGMPGGTTIDESNFEIMRDGTRRRRKGVRPEAGGTPFVFDSNTTEGPTNPLARFACYRWVGVANNPDKILIAAKVGSHLYFWDEGATLSTSMANDSVDLRPYTSYGDSGSTYEYITAEPITMASMHGRLFVAGVHLNPLYITYDPETEEFTVTQLSIRIRDLTGIEDGVSIGERPTTLSATHNYNLANRGWNSSTMAAYFTGQLANDTTRTSGKYPAKNQIWWKALVRYGGGYSADLADLDKLRKFDTNAIEQEVWGTVSAPQGHLFLNPFDTQVGTTDGVEDTTVVNKVITDIDSVQRGATVNNPDGSYSNTIRLKLTLNNTSPAWSAGNIITLNGTVVMLKLRELGPDGSRKKIAYDLSNQKLEIRSETGYTPTATEIYVDFLYTGALLYTVGSVTEIVDSVVTYGYASKGGFYTKPTGYTTTLRPTAVATFAGRVWFAGCDHEELADTIMFSQVGASTIDGAKAYSKMYQAGDPTAEYLSIVLPTDGGTIQIPGLSGVKAMVTVGKSIVILANTGVWEISGGDQYFSALAIEVRKIADAEILSPQGYAITDVGLMLASPRGLFKIGADQQSGRLNAGNVTLDTIQTAWNSITSTAMKTVQLCYDNELYRLYIFHKVGFSFPGQKINRAFVYDLTKESFYKLSFPGTGDNYIHGVVMLNNVPGVYANKKLKFFVVSLQGSSDSPYLQLDICDMENTQFLDWNDSEQIPFLETGYDGIGEANYRAQDVAQASPDHMRHRFSPNVFVYMKRTETGVDTETLEVQGKSSLLMEGRWEFTDNYESGNISSTQEVYRPRSKSLTEIPSGTVVISRSKVRGKGRSLHLKFTGQPGMDAHLLGYSIEYKAERKA